MVQHITIKINEVPNLIRNLYRAINKNAECFYCGRQGHYLQIAVDKEKHLLTRKICHSCEISRRKKQWLKKPKPKRI